MLPNKQVCALTPSQRGFGNKRQILKLTLCLPKGFSLFGSWKMLKIYGSTSTSPENISTSTDNTPSKRQRDQCHPLPSPQGVGLKGLHRHSSHCSPHQRPWTSSIHSPGNGSFIILVCVLPLPKEKNIINWEEEEEKDLDYISTLSACFSALLEFDIFR